MDAAIRHDAARKLAYELVGIIAPCLRQEEQLEALREFYSVIRAGLDAYEVARNAPTTARGIAAAGRAQGE